MADGLANALSLIANYSNYYSVLSVLICFILMVIFILRLNGDILLSSSAVHHRVVQEQSMLGLQNPFSVHLLKGKTSSLKDGLYIDMSVLDSTLVAAVWGINIPAFQQTLQLPSIEIWERFKSKSLFDGKYIEYQDCGQVDVSSSSREIYVACPQSITEASLGEPPRQVYPVVIVTARENPDISLNYTAIVVQFTVLHLKDSVCSLDSHIVYQFLKTNQNQLLSLQPIFVSTTEAADITQPTRQTLSPKTFQDNTAAGESTDKLMASVKQSSQSEQSIKLESSADSHVESVSHQDEKHIVQENCSGRCEDNLLDTDHEKSFVVNSSDLAQLSAVTAGDCAKSEELKLSAVTAGDCAKSEELKLSAVTAGDCAKSEELKLSAVTAGDCAKSEKLKLSAVTAGDCAKSEKLKLSAVTAGDCAKSEELKLSAVTADDCAKSEELKLSAVTAGDCAKSEELKLSAVTADDYAKSEELTPSLRDTKFHTKLEDNDAEDRLTDTVEVCDVSEEATNLCVVCQNAPVFYTLLQCRHACVCFTCIKLLEKCPMCRGFIDSYFRLDAAPDPVISDSVEEVVGPRVPWWEALNNRLNHLLGFE